MSPSAHVAFRSCRLPLMSPSALGKSFAMLCLLIVCLLLLLMPPAKAQGSWNGRPCDAQGNLLDNWPYNNGFYVLAGTQTGTLSNTYPPSMILAGLAYPSWYGDYLGAADPLGIEGLGVSPVSVSFSVSLGRPNDRVGVYTPDFAYADNYGSGEEGSYNIDAAHGGPSSGAVNGSVTGDMSGTLLCYFHMYWSGPGPQPSYATFLVSTSLYAQASVDYGGSQLPSGLSATATASDGLFNETASASAGDGASVGGVPTVNGLHLVQASVDPVTGVAEVYVNGTTHWALSNAVPYQTAGRASASGGSLVQAGAIVDNREVTISSSLGQTYHKGSQSDANGVALPEADTPFSNGTGLATTVVPYLSSPSVTTTPDGNCSSNIIYTAHPNGLWATDSTYQWNAKIGDAYGQPLDGTFWSDLPPTDLGLGYIPMDEPGGNVSAGNQEQVTINLKDAHDGAVAAGIYNVTFHAPTENWVLWDTENPFWQGATADSVESPGYAFHGSGVAATWTYSDTFWAQAGAAFSSVGSNLVPGYWSAFVAAAGIAFSQVQPKQVSQTVNFSDGWNNKLGHSTFDPKPPDNSQGTMTLYQMVPELYVQYQPQIWRGDAYAVSGYTGGVQTAVDKFLAIDTAGDFTLITSDPTGGN